MIKIKLNSLDEAAKWRSTDFKKEWTIEELKSIQSKYTDELLFVHFDDGVNVDGDIVNSSGLRADYRTIKDKDGDPIRRVAATLQPQGTFNPKTVYSTPIGIYAYPWSYAKGKLLSGGLPFAQDKQFLYIYAAKSKSNMLLLKDAQVGQYFEKSITKVLTEESKNRGEVITALRSSGVNQDDSIRLTNLFLEPEETTETKPLDQNSLNQIYLKLSEDYIQEYRRDNLTPSQLNHLKNKFISFLNTFQGYILGLSKDIMISRLEDIPTLKKTIDSLAPFSDTSLAVSASYLNKNIDSPQVKEIFKIFIDSVGGPDKPRKVKAGIPSSEEFNKALSAGDYSRRWFYFVNNICGKNPIKVTKFFQD